MIFRAHSEIYDPPIESDALIPSRGWCWDPTTGSLRREDSEKPATAKARVFYRLRKSNLLVDLPLTVAAMPDYELKTGELKRHWTNPNPAGPPWLIDAEIEKTADFTKSPVHRSLCYWLSQGHSESDPNLENPERMFTNVVHVSGQFVDLNSTAAVRHGHAHDQMLRVVEPEDKGEIIEASQHEIAINKALLKNDIDGRAITIERLRREYNDNLFKVVASQISMDAREVTIVRSENHRRLSLPGRRDVEPYRSKTSPSRKFAGLAGDLKLIPFLPTPEKLRDFYIEAMMRKMDQDWEKECIEANDLYQDVINEALEQARDDSNYREWIELFEWVRRPKNRGENHPPRPLPPSPEALWLATVWDWRQDILKPAKPCQRAEIIQVRRSRKGEHHDLPGCSSGNLAGDSDALLAVPPSEVASSTGIKLDRCAENHSDGSYADASGDHDDENVGSDLQSEHVEDFGRRKTKNPVEPQVLRDELIRKRRRGTLTNTDMIDYIMKLQNVSKKHAAAILGEGRVNTLNKQISRNRRKTMKAATIVCPENLCNGGCKHIETILDKMVKTEPEMHARIIRDGGWYLLIKMYRQPYDLKPLDIEQFKQDPRATNDEDRADLAIDGLHDHIIREALRQTMRKLDDGRRLQKMTEHQIQVLIEESCKEAIDRIEDAFDLAETFHFDQKSTQAA